MKMDDLDHSMHIAEYDWASFFEESEECCLLQASLACPDNSSLSDSEDPGNSSSVFSAGLQEPQQRPAGCCVEEAQINQRGLGGDDCTAKAEEDTVTTQEVYTKTAEHIREEERIDNTTTLKTERLNVQSSDGESTELKKEDVKTETDTCELKHTQEPDQLSCNQTDLNEPLGAGAAVSEAVAFRAEKERWFVTVNDSPARQRLRAPSVKKKRRQKKAHKDNHMCRSPRQVVSLENSSEKEINKESDESEGRETESVTHPSAEENPERVQMGVTSDSSQVSLTSGEEDDLSGKHEISHSPTENIIEPSIDGNKHDPSGSASAWLHTFTPQGPSQLDSMESDEFGDSVDFFSTHSYDSEVYLSATESVEELQRLFTEDHHLQSSLPLTQSSYLSDLTENKHDGEMDSAALSNKVTASSPEGYENLDTQTTLTFPSAVQSVNTLPDVDPTCDNHTHSTPLCRPSDTTGLQKHEINLSASVCSSGDQLLPIPDLTVTPCSVADSPEAYAEAAGRARPVFAISAFWDEMEKLTINDILQLRMSRSPSTRDTQETVTPNVEDFSANPSSLVDSAEYNLSDGGLMDTSDNADSDYFTQLDESKPDRSSCEFSTSDFEEEYWQFLGASGNQSPDPQSRNQQRDSPYFSHEEESTGSEGKETPVPSEDFAGQCFEHQDLWPRCITKTKSLHNIQSLSTEDSSLQVYLGKEENSLLLSSCPALEEDVDLKSFDSPGTLIPGPLLSNTDLLHGHIQTSFSDFGYFFTEDKAKTNSQCVAIYDPKDISVAPVFDYTLCTFRDETSLFSLSDSQRSQEKPIPIFSCSHSTVRELTFPNPQYVFLNTDLEEEDDFSPIRVVSHPFIRRFDCGTSAAPPRGFHSWKGLLSIRKIHFHDKGSIWCRRSGAWVFPAETETVEAIDEPTTVLTEGRVSSSPLQLFGELAVRQGILETTKTSREGIFSTLRQSDMCLVCIAFASWVLRSSDPEAADAWKAALLANVSALSAIQYLRQYVKKNPSQDHL